MNETKKNLSNIILSVAAAVIAVAAIVLAIIFVLPLVLKTDYSLYIRDGAVYYSHLSEEDKPVKLTANLYKDDESTLSLEDLSVLMEEEISFCQIGKTLFYPEKMDSETFSYTLNYLRPEEEESETVKIDADVYSYETNLIGSYVAYIRGSNRNLYLFQTKTGESTKIDSNVTDYHISTLGNKIIYHNEEGALYRYDGSESLRISRDVSSIEHISKSGKDVYYIKDDELYCYNTRKDTQTQIAEDVAYVLKAYDSGEVYYLTSTEVTHKYEDYVTDILAETDAALTAAPEEPIRADYEDVYAYEEAYTDYEELLELYESKSARDNLREFVLNSSATRTEYQLYFYDGETTILLSDNYAFNAPEAFCFAEDKPIVIFKQYLPDYFTLDILDLLADADTETYIDLSLYTTYENYLFLNGAIDILPHVFAQNLTFTADGSKLYFVDDVLDTTGCGSLYEVSFTENSIDRIRKCDENIHYNFYYDEKTESLAYISDVNDLSCGKLFFHGERIDKDVLVDSFTVLPKSGQIAYYKDLDEEAGCASLVIHNGKDTEKLSKTAYDYFITPLNHILYLEGYDEESGTGKLILYTGKDKWSVANKVNLILR